jgi:hypothetical protein
MKKQSYFLFLITMLCLAFAGSNTSYAQITKEGVKIRLFTLNAKGKSQEMKTAEIQSWLESSTTICTGDDGTFDQISLSGNATITIVVREGWSSDNAQEGLPSANGQIVYLKENYSLNGKKASFKPFEQLGLGRWTVYIKKDDITLLQCEYELLSCT